jgi:hypothetical protein
MTPIKIRRSTYEALMARAIFPRDDRTTEDHADGTITMHVDDEVAERLRRVDPDPERAILLTLGVREN